MIPDKDAPKIDDSVLSLSPEEIERFASWTGEKLLRLPEGQYLTKRDLEAVVLAWRQKNGSPEKPRSTHWQRPDLWKQGPNLTRINLVNRALHRVDLTGAVVQYAEFDYAHLDDAKLMGAWLWRASLREARLSRTDLRDAVLYEADLTGAEFYRANLSNARLTGAVLERTRLLDANLAGAYFYRARLSNTELTSEQLGGAIGEERDRSYRGAAEAYSRLKANFESLGRYSDAGWAYRKERRMCRHLAAEQAYAYHKEGRHLLALHCWVKWLKDWTVELLCDYGESIWRVLGWGACIFFLIGPALVHAFGGLVDSSGLPMATGVHLYKKYLLYMIDAFTTAGYSHLSPANDAVSLTTGLISLISIFLTGLLGFVAGNRIRNA